MSSAKYIPRRALFRHECRDWAKREPPNETARFQGRHIDVEVRCLFNRSKHSSNCQIPYQASARWLRRLQVACTFLGAEPFWDASECHNWHAASIPFGLCV